MLIADTGPLFAAASTSDVNHQRCVELLAATDTIVVPQLVVAETAYLLGERIGPHAELSFARSLAAGELVVEPVVEDDWARVAELVEEYTDMPLGVTDASVVALAERLNAPSIASLDHRHLSTVRPRHVEALQLLP